MLPLPMSTEINMQNLMHEAFNCYHHGQFKISFELYIEALLSAIKEFQQIEFIGQSVKKNNHQDMENIFSLAHSCLTHVKSITSVKNQKRRPVVPPKPSALKATAPPPLPERPTFTAETFPVITTTSMVRTRSGCLRKSKALLFDNQDEDDDEDEDGCDNIKRKSLLPRRSSTSNISKLDSQNNNDDLFLLSNSTIDPNIVVQVQTTYSDNSLQSSNTNYLPMIPQAPLVALYQSLGGKKKLDSVVNKEHLQLLLNKVRNIHMSATTIPTVLQFQPILIAYQLTLIDSIIFRNIPTDAILTHSTKTPHPSIVKSTDFFNYLTRIIEHAILLQQDASGRAQYMNHWIKTAGKCLELKNYQTLKAIISALGTPPIQRLKRSWSFIPKKSLNLFEELSDLMSEASNYDKYRSCILKNAPSPLVPFLGIFIHDVTYLLAILSKQSKSTHNSQWSNAKKEQQSIQELKKDVRVSELLASFKTLQNSPPYSPNVSTQCIKDLNKNRKRKLSHALITRSSSSSNYQDDGELNIEMQQCLITQYLLTRSWVSEKTVDELSLLREPTKSSRSYSDVCPPTTQQQPILTSSISLTTTRSSSGSSNSSSNASTRPISLEDADDDLLLERKGWTNGGFWLFGRKSVEQGYLKEQTLSRSPRHFSFEDLNSAQPKKNHQLSIMTIDNSSIRMQCEGSSQSSLASIFRKDSGNLKPTQQHHEAHY